MTLENAPSDGSFSSIQQYTYLAFYCNLKMFLPD